MENWSKKSKIVVAILAIVLITVFFAINTNEKSSILDYDIKAAGEVDKTQKLEIGQAYYVEFEEIKNSNPNIKKDSALKYVQVEVKNISKETLYYVELEQHHISEWPEDINKKWYNSMPLYAIDTLKSGETAQLSAQMEDVSEGIELHECYYNDGDGNKLNFSNPLDENLENREIIIETDYKLDFMKLTDEINKLKFKNAITDEQSTEKLFEMEVQNTSDQMLQEISVAFIERSGRKAVGNIYANIENLPPNKLERVILELKNDNDLSVTSYVYKILDSETQKINVYTVYPEENTYETYSYEDAEAAEKNDRIEKAINSAVLWTIVLVTLYEENVKKKIGNQESTSHLKRLRYLKFIKWILIITYCILVLRIIFNK